MDVCSVCPCTHPRLRSLCDRDLTYLSPGRALQPLQGSSCFRLRIMEQPKPELIPPPQKMNPIEWVVKEIPHPLAVMGEPESELHVMPARAVPEVMDVRSADLYMRRLKQEGDPVVMFGPDGEQKLFAYWGHKPSPQCECGPTSERKGTSMIYTHKAPN